LELRSEAFGDEFLVETFVSSEDLLGSAVAEGLG
jgi:hypothetical protein